MQIYLETSSLKGANNVPKLPGFDYVAKNWALARMLKALLLARFLSVLSLKEQMITSVRKTLKTMVWSRQNRWVSCEICHENNHKSGRFLPTAFWRSLPWNFPPNSRQIGRFFHEFLPKNPAKFDFSLRDLSEALNLKAWNHWLISASTGVIENPFCKNSIYYPVTSVYSISGVVISRSRSEYKGVYLYIESIITKFWLKESWIIISRITFRGTRRRILTFLSQLETDETVDGILTLWPNKSTFFIAEHHG